MKKPSVPQQLSFRSQLERISTEANYFALSVPEKISRALGTRSAVPIIARVNGSVPFRGSLFPVGEGRHFMRVKAEIRNAVKIKEGDRVQVEIEVVDRSTETSIPKDLERALRAEGVLEDFKTLPPGKLSYTLRWIDKAAKPETREKRIQAAVEEARCNGEKRSDRRRDERY